MEQYIIKGGNPLVGEVEIGGAKNAALAILAAAIMTDETVLIDNLPDVNDVNVMLEAISGIGARVQRIDRHTVKINGSTIGDFNIEYDYIKKIRASYYLLGALLGKYRKAEVALPGGCNIGSRPIDQHLKGFRALGADVDIEHGKIVAEAEVLHGTHLYFDVVTVGATINVMMAAAMADGLTIMENVAKEPHVVDVANFLNSMGANIRGAGTDVIKIRGVQKLHKTEYSIIPDQIEAGTFMFAAAATRGDVTVMNVIPKHLDATISKLVDIGCEIEEFDDAVRVVAKSRLRCTQVKTLPYPGYPTDMQPQIGVALALAKGTSTITESIFENRFKYLDELARMGAVIKVEGNSATIEGIERFSGARVSAPDLRAGAALCIAGLAAEGITIVDDIVYIQRGYERFEEKLRSLGGMIERVSSDKEIQKFKLKVG
ncbi:MAG TPA: UDP-N-acetylglucosamine 1-carboxyvinyltransferase [Candidatus Mediterraneibacter norfolkensis]|nr:UDP-N-acetylglucosamine 1-carboxyvinyltransferase [Candidatus Mediterraneibacter norfolkensis]